MNAEHFVSSSPCRVYRPTRIVESRSNLRRRLPSEDAEHDILLGMGEASATKHITESFLGGWLAIQQLHRLHVTPDA